MFIDFFYALKAKGLKISLNEWLTLQDALNKDLAKNSLAAFYYVARAVLVKNETDYDKFDLAFDECFKGINSNDIISKEMLRWLNKEELTDLVNEDLRSMLNREEEPALSKDEIEAKLNERKKEQDSEHNGGNYWIGTMGKTSFGNTGANLGGIRIGGMSGHQSAFAVLGERKYKDFRDDRIIDNRQFQLALRKLRQFSTRLDIPRTELDINGTIDKTCTNGGFLQIVMEKPRKNAVKLLLLMDSGGTMIPYTSLLNELFQSVHKANHYKDVKCYYFHNCIYSHLYKTPECENGDWIETEWLFRNLESDYKVIIVGDAAMAPEELYSESGNYRGPNGGLSGFMWLKLLKQNYRKIVWLNPKMAPGHAPWREAETAVKNLLPMYKLTVAGLKKAMDELMLRK
ncbi:MAG: VWA containing CoxE family protein [Lachnospiraceae bacterium]|nr:VWA containing CoxE family protein [Lachnospiraceae bacterium]